MSRLREIFLISKLALCEDPLLYCSTKKFLMLYFFYLQWPIIYKIYGDKHRHLAAAVLPPQVRPIMSRQVPVAVHPTSILYSTLLPYWLQMQQQHYRWHCLPQDLLHRKQPQGRGYIHQDQHRMTYTMARMGLTHHLVLSIR